MSGVEKLKILQALRETLPEGYKYILVAMPDKLPLDITCVTVFQKPTVLKILQETIRLLDSASVNDINNPN